MRLDIGKVISDERYTLPFSFTLDLSSHEMVDGLKPFVSPVSVSGTVTSRYTGIEVKAEISAQCCVPCARCLEPVDFQICTDIDGFIGETPDEDDLLAITGGRYIELDNAVLERLDDAYPAKVVCRDDCRGLCPICGQNLNEAECGCLIK